MIGNESMLNEVAGRDDVGAAEIHEAVAVGRRVRRVDDLHAFVVEERADFVLGREIGFRRQRRRTVRRRATMRFSTFSCASTAAPSDESAIVPATLPPVYVTPLCGDGLVTADAVRQRARVDDVAHGLRRRMRVHGKARPRLRSAALRRA